jgi:hypothetical protein
MHQVWQPKDVQYAKWFQLSLAQMPNTIKIEAQQLSLP